MVDEHGPSDVNESTPPESSAAALSRSAARLAKAARRAGRRTQPRATRLPVEGMSAARPVLERTGRFVRQHEDALKQAGMTAARVIAPRVVSPAMRPVVTTLTNGLATPAPPGARNDKCDQSVEAESKPEQGSGPLVF